LLELLLYDNGRQTAAFSAVAAAVVRLVLMRSRQVSEGGLS
jgi:hypothetical protein